MSKNKVKKSFSGTQLYVDAVACARILTDILKSLPRPIQHSMGELAVKDVTELAQLLRLAYGGNINKKKEYIEKAIEKLACMEVTIVLLFECKYININKKAEIYKLLGSMEKQSRAWLSKESSKESTEET